MLVVLSAVVSVGYHYGNYRTSPSKLYYRTTGILVLFKSSVQYLIYEGTYVS